jgi:hypothetical protein
MTDFNYKKYSLEHLENWLHDAMSAGEATPQEIYDVIKGVVEENYYHYKHHASQAYELLALINGHGKDYISKITDAAGNDLNDVDGIYIKQSPLYCDYDDPSEECKGSWNSFWEENYYPDEYSVREAEYYNKQDKVVKWQLPVEMDGPSGEYFVTFPDDLLEAAGLKENDTVEWVDNGNGSYTLRKTNVK